MLIHVNELERLKLRALEATVNGVVITDIHGTILWANPAFETLTGYSASEVIGGNPRILKSGKTPDSVYESLWFTLASGKVWRGSIINRRKDGSDYHEEMTITPVLSEDRGLPQHFVAVKSDVSKRVKAEKARDALLEKMEATTDSLKKAFGGALQALANMAELQKPSLGKHGRRVADIARGIAVQMGVEDECLIGQANADAHNPSRSLIWGAALLHDIGKALELRTPAFDTPEQIRRFGHVHKGESLLKSIPGSESIQLQILHHHERWDGEGYPAGLSGEAIPLGSRIIAVASAFDHLMHRRHLSSEDALARIKKGAGSLYDPGVADGLQRDVENEQVQEALDGNVLISFYDLQPGMILADECRTSAGLLLYSGGTELTARAISRLRAYHDREPSFDAVRVRRILNKPKTSAA